MKLRTAVLSGLALLALAIFVHAVETNTVISVGGGRDTPAGAVTKVVSTGSTPSEIIDQTTRSIENGDIKINTAGKGLKIKEGSVSVQGTLGRITLASPSVLYSNANVTANTRVFCFRRTGNTVNGLMYSTNCPSLGVRLISAAETNDFDVLLLEPQ